MGWNSQKLSWDRTEKVSHAQASSCQPADLFGRSDEVMHLTC